MRACTILALVGLGSLTFAQSINLTYVDAHTVATPTLILYQKQQIVEYNQATAISAVIAAVSATPIADPGEQGLDTREPLHKRDSPVAVVMRVLVPACQALNGTLYDVPVNGTVADPVAKFLKDMVLQEQAISAITPHGYTQVFQNIKNSSQANGYMGYTILSTYNVSECANVCTRTLGCQAFNIYFERGPSKVPGVGCQNPPALVNPFCALWGGPVSTDNALNEGQYREQFHVVITASNGYVVNSSLNRLSSFAILAPLDCNGNDSYMGMRLLTDGAPFDRQRCAAICDATTQYNIVHAPEDPVHPPRLCKFYNTFILSKNFISQGQYCAMYSQYWDPELYARNSDQYDGAGNHYTISSSEFFHNETDVTSPICPADLSDLEDNVIAKVFCSSYVSYASPAAVSTTITNTATLELCSTTTTIIAITSSETTGIAVPGSSVTPADSTSTACLNPTTLHPTEAGATPTVFCAGIVKRDTSPEGVNEAVVAVYPDKVPDPAITGSVPAEFTISAAELSVAGAYSSATSKAVLKLGVDKTDASFPTYSAVSTEPPQTTPSAAIDKRQTALMPWFFEGRDYRDISSACSQIVDTATPTATYHDPVTATVSSVSDCSNVTVCADKSPPNPIGGSFHNASTNLDDVYFSIKLPFEICIYSTCNSTVRPSSNGIITLGNSATAAYDNDAYGIPTYAALGADGLPLETALFVYWDDLYIFRGQPQYMDYSICGPVGARSVVFSWKVGKYIRTVNSTSQLFDGRTWSFSATFFENLKGRINLKYDVIPDHGVSASVGMQGSGGEYLKYSHLQSKVANGLQLRFGARNDTSGAPRART